MAIKCSTAYVRQDVEFIRGKHVERKLAGLAPWAAARGVSFKQETLGKARADTMVHLTGTVTGPGEHVKKFVNKLSRFHLYTVSNYQGPDGPEERARASEERAVAAEERFAESERGRGEFGSTIEQLKATIVGLEARIEKLRGPAELSAVLAVELEEKEAAIHILKAELAQTEHELQSIGFYEVPAEEQAPRHSAENGWKIYGDSERDASDL